MQAWLVEPVTAVLEQLAERSAPWRSSPPSVAFAIGAVVDMLGAAREAWTSSVQGLAAESVALLAVELLEPGEWLRVSRTAALERSWATGSGPVSASDTEAEIG